MLYLSGIPSLTVNERPASIRINPDHLLVSVDLTRKAKIPTQNITNVLEKTEQQITKDVTLTRMLTLGVFAFGLRKKRRHTDRYLIIEYTYMGQEITAVFLNPPQGLYSRIFTAMVDAKQLSSTDREILSDQIEKSSKQMSIGLKIVNVLLYILGFLLLLVSIVMFTQNETVGGIILAAFALVCFFSAIKIRNRVNK